MKQTIQQQLATEKVLPLLLRLSLPVTLAQLVHVLYNIVDRMFIGHMPGVGTDALASMSFTMPILLIVSAFSNLIGMGGAPMVSIRLGQKKHQDAAKLQGMSMTLLILIGTILTIIFFAFCDPLMLLFGASENLLGYASEYLKIYLIGTIFMMVSVGMNSFLNAQGCTLEATITMVAGTVINIILDPIFIYKLDMGIAGAALASVIAQGVSAVWTLWLLCRSKRITIPLKLCDMRLNRKDILMICKLGASSFIFDINECFVTILLNLLLRKYSPTIAAGDLYISAMTIINTLLQIFFMPLKGITRGAQPIIGYCFGARNFDRLMSTVKYARICSITCATTIWAIVMLFPRQLASIFSNDAALLDLSAGLSRLFFCTIFVLGLQMVNQYTFICIGNAKLSFLFGIMRKILILVPLVITLPLIFGINGVFLAEPISNVITVIITQIVFTKHMNKLRAKLLD